MMNCDPIAGLYRWIEYAAFGPVLQRTRLRWLEEMRGARRVLLLGDGDGRFLSHFVSTYPEAELHYIDSSARMLDLARKRIRGAKLVNPDRVKFIEGNALTTTLPSGTYDLVVSHFFLDCFGAHALSKLAQRVGSHLAHDARWVVSDFSELRDGLMARASRFYLRLMFLFFRFTTGLETNRLADYSAVLEGLGLVRTTRETKLGGFVFSEVWCSPESKAGRLCDAADEPGGQHNN